MIHDTGCPKPEEVLTPGGIRVCWNCHGTTATGDLVRSERIGRAIEAALAEHPGYAPAPRVRKSFEQSGGIGEGSDA